MLLLLECKANIAARKEWGMSSGNTGHCQAHLNASDKSFLILWSLIKLFKIAIVCKCEHGMSNDDWMAEVIYDNITDERAEISNTFVFDRQLSVYKTKT